MSQNEKRKLRPNVRFVRTSCPNCCGRGYIYVQEPSPEYTDSVKLTEKQVKDIT